MNDIKQQLAPGWSGVNVGLTVVLFLVAKPLALLMIAYIIWGRQLGLDLSRPQTFAAAGTRLMNAFRAGHGAWRGEDRVIDGSGGRPEPHLERERLRERDLDREAATLAAEREALERDRAAFEAGRTETPRPTNGTEEQT